MMLLSDWFYERREKRIQAESEKGREEGRKKGREEGREEGRREGYAEGYAAAKAENGSVASPSKPSNTPPRDKENS